MMKLERYGKILEPEGDIGAIFNCGATVFKDEIHLLPRVVKTYRYEKYISEIHLAKSKDGKNFVLDKYPLIVPDKPYDKFGCEDARVTKLDDEYLVTYTALSSPANSGKGRRIGLASTKDFTEVKKHGVIGPDFNSKAGTFFPERIDGRIVFLFKNEKEEEKVQIAYFGGDIFDREDWIRYWQEFDFKDNVLLSRRENEWENYGVETGPPPIKTELGWLLIYSGISKKPEWSVGAALLDLDNPKKVKSRSTSPILSPEMEYEKKGDVSNVTFPEGAVVRGDELYLYYGAADKACCLATCNLDELLDSLENSE